MLNSKSDDHDQLDPAEALMREVGAQLRQVRLERGEELDEVAQQLRIKATYLFGIEQGDLSTIPGRTYALGFLRSYADYLGFDGDDLISQIKSTVANLTDKTRLRIRTPLAETRLPKTPLLVLSLAVVAGIYGGWSYVNHGSQIVIETVAEVPGNLRNLALGAFRDRGDGGVAPAPGADAGGARPRQAAALTEPMAHEPRPTVARAAPMPERGAAAPAPESHPQAARAAASDPPGTRAPTAVIEPGAPPVPTVQPEVRPPTGAVQADATPGAASPATGPTARAPAASAAPDVAPAGTAPEPPTSAPDRLVAPAGGIASQPPPAVVAAAPAATASAGQNASPVTDPAPAAGTAPLTTDAEAGARQEQLAALSLDPAAIGPIGRIHEQENSDARVVIRALESSWIQISSPSGDYLRDRTLEPTDVFLVPNRPDLELWTGNAGGLEVIVDGTVLAPLGDSGAVVRDVSLDPASLRGRLGQARGR